MMRGNANLPAGRWGPTGRLLSVPRSTRGGSGGGGGGIRTPDLWVMSPTSCRCSTPRHDADPCPDGGRRAGAGGARGGLASRGVAPPVLSGAAAGHDRVRDGTGWVRRALGHGPAPRPPAGRRPDTSASTSLPPAAGESPAAGALPGTAAVVGRNRTRCAGSAPTLRTPGSPVGPRRAGPLRFSSLARPAPAPARRRERGPAARWQRRPRPLGRVGSGRSPAVHPPPIDPVVSRGPYLFSEWGDSSWDGIPA
jgi:hypothetical protein